MFHLEQLQVVAWGEGFRFEESDMDVMEYPEVFQVIWDHSQNQHKSFLPQSTRIWIATNIVTRRT